MSISQQTATPEPALTVGAKPRDNTGPDALPARQPRRKWWHRISVNCWRLIALAVFLIAWHLISIPAGKLLLPSPLAVFPAFLDLLRSGQLIGATAGSLVVFSGGYLLAVLVGIPAGVLMGGFRRVGETFDIYVNGLNSTPRVAFVPLIVLWFGLDIGAKIVIVWVTAVFPIIINTYAGVLNTDKDLIEAARSFGANQRQIFRYIMLPSAIPYIVAGLRIGASLAIIGTVVAELYTALSGLGHMLDQFGNSFQTAKYFVPLLVLIGIGTAISQSLKALERRLARWKTSSIEI
ncbi:MAG TPA: ABC transporter permease [Terriglobales bacterium]|jgi:NitT/TauT family transport system permease protein|nr:ABC transporter permease [Terriglobales bacterium]